ncbi:MAG: hypothetical protein ACI31R_00465 [Bacilli bacterium]
MNKQRLKEIIKSKKFKQITIILVIALIISMITIRIIHIENEKTKQEVLKNIEEVLSDKLLPEDYVLDTSKDFHLTKDQIKYIIQEETIKKENKTLYSVEVRYPYELKVYSERNSRGTIKEDTFYIEILPKTKEIKQITLKNKEVIYTK